MLPVPKDPNFKIPEKSDEEYWNPTDDENYDEDAKLLATGAWDDQLDETEEE
jgi:hypothetical protein